MTVCSRCGATVEDGKSECTYCGVSLWQTDTAKESYDKDIGQYHARHDYISSVGKQDIYDEEYSKEIGRMHAQIDANAEAWYKRYQLEQQIKEEEEKKRKQLYEEERKEALKTKRKKYIQYIFISIVIEAVLMWSSGGILSTFIGRCSLYSIFLGLLFMLKIHTSKKSEGVWDFCVYIFVVFMIYLWWG